MLGRIGSDACRAGRRAAHGPAGPIDRPAGPNPSARLSPPEDLPSSLALSVPRSRNLTQRSNQNRTYQNYLLIRFEERASVSLDSFKNEQK